jgi:hypothetical protein
LLYFQCCACRYQCSLISGTIFESTKLALTSWFLAMQMFAQSKNGVSALELMRQLGVSYPTAWLVKQKLMEVMFQREQTRQLSGRIEMDDAYLGGEVHGGKSGRGSPNKVPFVCAVQTTEAGRAHLMCLSLRPFTNDSLKEFAAKSLVAPATVVSDGLGCFTVVADRGLVHERHVTGGGAASAGRLEFRAVNTALANLKTSLAGTFHAFDFAKYGHRYLGLVQYLFNRRYKLAEIVPRLLRAACISSAQPLWRIRAAEVHC